MSCAYAFTYVCERIDNDQHDHDNDNSVCRVPWELIAHAGMFVWLILAGYDRLYTNTQQYYQDLYTNTHTNAPTHMPMCHQNASTTLYAYT